METIHAIFENGVFRPVAPVSIPENTEVEFEPRLVGNDSTGERARSESLRAVYEILGERYASGISDTAERHNEHQP